MSMGDREANQEDLGSKSHKAANSDSSLPEKEGHLTLWNTVRVV